MRSILVFLVTSTGYIVSYLWKIQTKLLLMTDEHLLSKADVTAAQTPTLDSETMKSPPKGASEAEEDFMSRSG